MKRKINVMTLCSGYDSQFMACRRIEKQRDDIEFNLAAWAEIDPYAIKLHNAVFPEYADRNVGDISKADWESAGHCDLLFYSTPCQSISTAGRQEGLAKGSGTRSSLLWEVERAIRELRPDTLLMENVAALTFKKFRPFFNEWQLLLERYGYVNYWKIMNAADYGVPQSRKRVFMVSKLKDGGAMPTYSFPKPFEKRPCIKDILEDCVDEKFYLKPKNIQSIIAHCDRKQDEGCGFKANFVNPDTDISGSIKTTEGSREYDTFDKCVVLANDAIKQDETGLHKVCSIYPGNHQDGKLYHPDGLAPSLMVGSTKVRTIEYVDSAPKIFGPSKFAGHLEYNKLDQSQCLTGDKYRQEWVGEPYGEHTRVLAKMRTEEEKERRRREGDEGAKFSAGKQLMPRADELTNTLTTCEYDNLLFEQRMDLINANADGSCPAITASYGKAGQFDILEHKGCKYAGVKEIRITKVGHIHKDREGFGQPSRGVVHASAGLMSTLCATDYKEPKLVQTNYRILGYTRSSGDGGKDISYHQKELANTVHGRTGHGGNTDQYVIEIVRLSEKQFPGAEEVYMDDKGVLTLFMKDGTVEQFRIRKLTPRECFRLMDVSDEDIDKMLGAGISKTMLYHAAGNSVVVACWEHILRSLLDGDRHEGEQLNLF